MNFPELCTEVHDYGFHSTPRTRVERWVNQAYLEICDHRKWTFVEATQAGTAPLTIADLGAIESVRLTSANTLLHHEYRYSLQAQGKDLAEAGTPTRYYITGGTVVTPWPTSALSITVNYWKVPAELTGSNSPIVPARYHDLIILGAVRRAYEDADDMERAEAVEARRQAGLALMVNALFEKDDRAPDREEKGQP
jgi:hypothetical protein